MSSSIHSRPFGRAPDGSDVTAWTLTGSAGMTLEVLTYGGVVRRLLTPDVSGELGDIVLGYATLEEYIADPYFMGATVGRVAGRIAKGQLKIGGRSYPLPINDPPNHLHGGPASLNTKNWDAAPLQRSDGFPSLKLSCVSPHGEQGYPGNLKLEVLYTVTGDNAFVFETRATVDAVSPVSVTHHSYFNLAGEGSSSVQEHRMQIFADSIFSSDEKMTLLDQLTSVESTAADLREARRLGDVIPRLWQRHGDLYWLGENAALRPAARVTDPGSGRTLEVRTTCSCLQTYFSAALDGSVTGKSGRPYRQYGGFCLECEDYPQAHGTGSFGDILLHPGEERCTTTIYVFERPVIG